MNHTRLSVNINKIALIRNSRGANFPKLCTIAKDCEKFGAEGITIHPRPDQRHATYRDVEELKAIVSTELNIEGNPTKDFMKVVLDNSPHQVTLVPDAENAITSDAGWDTITHRYLLQDITEAAHAKGIRVSIFVDPIPAMIYGAKEIGVDRVELYTGPYALQFVKDPIKAIQPYVEAAKAAKECRLALNAGHDLNLDNLRFFKSHLPFLDEVSIGHALVVDALYYGLANVIPMYQSRLSLN